MVGGEKQREDDRKQEDREIKVTDRRLFDTEGQLRGELPDDDDDEARPDVPERAKSSEEPGGRADAPPTGPTTGFEHRPVEPPEGVDFTMLISAMAQPALVFLGEVAHPGTGRPEVNFEQARIQIDLLDLLRVKCRGNLSAEEEGLLDRMLYQIRMLYVSRAKQPDQ